MWAVLATQFRLRSPAIRHHARRPLQFALRGTDSSERLPLVLAGGAAALILSLAEGPARAKAAETHQEVYAWGRAESIPGGSPSDVLWPKRISWFEQNPAGWSKIVFGPDFGAAVDRRGRIFVWGAGAAPGTFVGPVEAKIQGDGKGQGIADVQFSAKKMFALTTSGHALVVEGFVEVLHERSGPAARARQATAAAAAAEEGSEEKSSLMAKAQEAEAAAAAAASSSEPLFLTATAVPGLPRPGFLARLFGSGGGVKQMSIGLEHGAFVTTSGELYSVGGNEWGQCGVTPPRQKGPMGALEERQRVEVEFPVRVTFPDTAGPIVSVEVGGRHTIARDNTGRCYSFGDDRRIQLGLGDTRTGGSDERHSYGVLHQDMLGGKKVKGDIQRAVSYRYYDPHMQSQPKEQVPPAAVNRPEYPPPSFMTCGEDFTVAVYRDSPDWYPDQDMTNVIMACGENGAGQCGRSLHQQQQAWSQVRMPKHSRTSQVRCGQAHCLALLTTGEVYAWGANPQGQVGNGKRALVPKPMRVMQEFRLPDSMASKKTADQPATVTAHDIYKQAMYRHAANKTGENAAPAAPISVPLPGKVTHVISGFRNSAVICEIPDFA
mmetsp:Transcript_35772/g.64897  ORF Transcript_35772/g.64897 Transcript_35772/m.64897 type:complete len:605 (-) Transcript_35772:56-1870(-)|eukprot:CAMPEP_0197631954 /NCGR_PEP_ID=MMETSP1338-20131121/8935_1 /TAXON_ID=43686 ORGANISM="Pelagodinium beii, Strain RCC1491" /NCGR_SAMPLE_ID=MMETSP1338 /ASSEMBLY_ACC=CAM_ASM_000754 /LENGTH=604 /DNA_ID=CAMNT_0043203499 /DNA_START=30 /DNA_END=1844 /DNA_ORIENTATION=+